MRECWKWEEFPYLSSPRTGKCVGESWKDHMTGGGRVSLLQTEGLKQPGGQWSGLAAHG